MRQCTSARPRAIWRWKSLAQLADRRLPAAMTNVTSVSQLSLLPLSALIHLRNAGTLAASASEAVSDQGYRPVMEKITFGDNIPGYIYGPEDAPGVVMLQEWWGYTTELEKQAINLSQKGGYRVLVPDLYKGKLGADKEEAHHLMSNLDWPTAKEEIKVAVDYLGKNGKKVGVVGFCMGGALTLIAAQHANVAAAAPFYGTPQEEICQVEKIKVPVLLQAGEDDSMEGFSTPKETKAVAEKIKAAGGNVEFHLYPKVGHAYMNGFTTEAVEKMEMMKFPRPDNLEEVQSQSWSRLLDFFKKHLVA